MFKSRAEAINAYQRVHYKRLALEHEAAIEKTAEKIIMDYLLQDMVLHNVTEATGKEWTVFTEPFVNASIIDTQDQDLFKFICRERTSGGFGLLYRRLNQDNVRAWQARGKKIPGIFFATVMKLHHRSKA